MIIRKPYTFFIKYFKRIHIALLIVSIFIYLRYSRIMSFLNEYMDLGVYDKTNDPISHYIPFYLQIIILLVAITCFIFILLLKRKNKPWKLYLVPFITYFVMFLINALISIYFNSFSGAYERSQITLYRDIAIFINVLEFPSLILFIVRILGVDLKKFNFQLDKEYLELSQEDQGEFEINIDFDKHSIERFGRKILRNLNYFYMEHKIIVYVVITVFSIILVRNTITTIASHKSYSQGDTYTANGYTIKVNNVYYTDKSFNGDIISDTNAYVIVDVTITNNATMRVVNIDHFHLFNGVSDYTESSKTNEKYFKDMGPIYDGSELGRGKSKTFLMIFKVKKNLRPSRFVLFYQEYNGSNTYLRKIKLKVNNLSKIKTQKDMSLGDDFTITIKGKDENIILDGVDFYENSYYVLTKCNENTGCENINRDLASTEDKKIMILSYGTDDYEAKDIIDFSTDYGKIIYIDSNGKKQAINMKSMTRETYSGKYYYTLVPREVEQSNELYIQFTIRNKRYIYKIK